MNNPYQLSPPSLKYGAEPSEGSPSPYVFRPATMLTPALRILYGLMIPLFPGMGIALLLLEWIDDQNPGNVDLVLLLAGAGAMFVGAAVFLATIITHCIWTNRMNKNARALGARDMENSPGWAVAYFFIPILHLFKPFTVASEIYRASRPGQDDVGWQDEPTPAILKFWWGFWIVGNILDRVSDRLTDTNATAAVAMIASCVTGAAAVCAFIWVGRVHRRQLESYSFSQPSPLHTATATEA